MDGSDDADVEAMHREGAQLASAGRLVEALAVFRRVVELRPQFARAQFNVGLILKQLGNRTAAEPHLRLAMHLALDAVEPRVELAELLASRGAHAEAMQVLDTSRPSLLNSDRVHAMRALLLKRTARFQESADALRTAIAIAPGSVAHRSNLALLLMEMGDTAAADVQLAPLLARNPPAAFRLRTAAMLPAIPDSIHQIIDRRDRFESVLDELATTDERIADPLVTLNSIPFYLAYAGLDDRPIMQKLAAAHRRLCPTLDYVATHCLNPARDKSARIRIGIVSTHLYFHTIGRLNVGLIEGLDRRRFELFIFDLSPDDALADRIRASADHVVQCPVTSLAALHQTIADCRLDVLFYPDLGMTPLTYYLAFARLAPVQCSTWGHPVTSGLQTVDYFLSSVNLESPGSQAQYTEALRLLTDVGTCYAKPAVPDTSGVRARFGFEDDWHVYLCPQSLFKIHPDFDAVLADILRRDRRARIVLLAGSYIALSGALLKRLQRSMGDDVSRVMILPAVASHDFLGLLSVADVNLDPFHFGGGHTSLEAFAVGCPVITHPSEFLRGRITYAQYQQMGLTDCIARSAEEYVALALRMANDPEWNRQMREAVLSQNHRLFSNRRVIEEYEAFFTTAAGSAGSAS